MGADDAAFLSKYFAPQFEPADLMQLHNRYFIATMTISGEKTPPFSGSSLNIPTNQSDFTAQIIEWSRQHYAKPKLEVEAAIELQTRPVSPQKPSAAPQPAKTVYEPPVSKERAKGAAKLFVGNLRKLQAIPTTEKSPASPPSNPVSTPVEKPQKRVRSKRKKYNKQTNNEHAQPVQPVVQTQQPQTNDKGETIIKLR
jgi:Holliday junction resolvase RusA-like endonuclease